VFHLRIEVLCHGRGGFVDGGERLLERRLVVERFAGVGDEDGGNHQRVAHDEHGRGGVPSGVAARFERGANAAAGERARVGLLLHEHFAAELFNHAALAVVFHEGVVFFGGAFGERLEPVRAVRGAHFDGPALHALRDGVGRLQVERAALFDGVAQLLIGLLGQIAEHFFLVEDVLSEVLCRPFRGRRHVERLLARGGFHNVKS